MKVLRNQAVRVALAGLWIGACGLLSAEEPPRLQPEWGTNALGVRTIQGMGFQPTDSSTTFSYTGDFHRFRTGGDSFLAATLPDLPAGALITGLELEGCDTNAGGSLSVYLTSRRSPIGPTDTIGTVDTGNLETPGCDFFGNPTNLIPVGHIVDNFNVAYWVRARFEATDETLSVGAVRIYYQLRVSPAPAVATFLDVPTTHGFFQFVEALAASGITAGCGSGNFCPDAPLTRGQMAVFLSKALGLHFPY
jgi:S-layer family protein